ncbi:MAG: methyl-accepting chemotaxis protein [Xanthobacteraceae bacterium]
MSIKMRLYGGFGVLVLLALALAIYGVAQFSATGSSVDKLNAIAANSTRTLQVQDYMEQLRRSALRYLYDHDEGMRKEFEDVDANMISALQTAEDKTIDEGRKKAYRDVATQLVVTQKKAKSLFDTIRRMAAEQVKLFKVGDDLSANAKTLDDKIQAGTDQALVNLGQKLTVQLLTLRVSNWRTQATFDPKGLATFTDAVSKATATIAALEAAEGSQNVRAQIAPVKASVTEYSTLTQSYITQLTETRDLYINQIAPEYRTMEATLITLREAVQGNFNETRSSVESSISGTVFNQEIIAALVLLVGSLIAFFIARSVSNPIQALTKAMRELAEGNFSVVLPGLKRKDEVGGIAKAVEAFKVKAAENATLEAAAKVEQDQRADVERQSALAKMTDEFQAVVGGIVEAAVAGDFSKRVELDGKTGLVLNVGTLINNLCDNVAKALDDLVHMLSALAEGNLTERITAEYQGDFGELKNNANTASERIGDTIAEIKRAANEVTNAAAEISGATTDLSQRTEEQAASLEETSASMEEIASTVKKNSENAQNANESATKAREVADRGGKVVAKAVEAMGQIEASAGKISDIIGVIDEIARQTNLLALNAAVEAARAGDAGRGFAVVASEVRTLAQRSSQAAKDIKDLITNSNGQVKAGVDLVNQAGTALAEILDTIKAVATVVSDIAGASLEQASGVEEVNKALAQMDEVTQQNSALVEENAATAKTLEHQAKAMDDRVAFFRLVEGAGASSAPAAAPTRAAATKPKFAAPPKRAARGGPVGQMRTALATAMKVNTDEEF